MSNFLDSLQRKDPFYKIKLTINVNITYVFYKVVLELLSAK